MVKRRTLIKLLVALVALAAAAPSQAAVSCAFGAGTATVSMTAAGDAASISVGTGANAGRIIVGVTICGAATTANTDTIVVNGSTGAENVTIDLSGGQFAPRSRGRGIGHVGDRVRRRPLDRRGGSRHSWSEAPAPTRSTLGASGVNLNGDNDVDVTLTGVELGTMSGSGGDDAISGGGDGVTGVASILA